MNDDDDIYRLRSHTIYKSHDVDINTVDHKSLHYNAIKDNDIKQLGVLSWSYLPLTTTSARTRRTQARSRPHDGLVRRQPHRQLRYLTITASPSASSNSS
jgi:hypothetical protein